MSQSMFRATTLVALVLVLGLAPACREADPTAPSDAILSINANPPTIALGGVARITVIASRADGVPVVDGTVINLTTTLGAVPETIYTRDGIADGNLEGGGVAGEATVTATAGAAAAVTTTVRIGSSSSFLTISASPGSLPFGGGSSTITAIAYDENSVPLAGIPVQFSTDHGTLSSGGSLLYTNSSGVVQDALSTTLTAVVTATSGGLSPATVTVTVDPEGSTDPPTSPGSIAVSANPPVIAPGQTSTITATVYDSTGYPLSGAGVVFSTTQGSLSSAGRLVYTDSRGQSRDALTTSQTATVTAKVGAVSGSVTVTVSNSSATTLSLSANPAQFSACSDVVTLRAHVTDANGNGVSGLVVDFALGANSVGALSATSATTDGAGDAYSYLTLSASECLQCSGASCQSAITATSGSLSDSFTVNVSLP